MQHGHKIFGNFIDFSNPGEAGSHIIAHFASLAAIGSIAMRWLPLVYGVFPAAYYCALFIGTPVVQTWLRKRRSRGYLTGRKATRHTRKR